MTWRDIQQDGRLRDLENQVERAADESVEDFKTLIDKVRREEKRNDVQSQRIKALSAVVEQLAMQLLAKGVLRGDDLAGVLEELKKANAPVKL